MTQIIIAAVKKVSFEIPKGALTNLRPISMNKNDTVLLSQYEYQAAKSTLEALRAVGYISYVDPSPVFDKFSCNFVIDAANGNGLGIRSLKSQGPVTGVFGHTTATPAPGNNLAAGFFKIFFSQDFSNYRGGFSGFVSPVSGTPVTAGSFVVGTAYVIVSVGNTNWAAVGVPSDITPAVGVAFVATAVGSGTGVAEVPSVSGIDSVEVVGDAHLTMQGKTPYMIIQTLVDGTPTAPAAGSVMGMTFYAD